MSHELWVVSRDAQGSLLDAQSKKIAMRNRGDFFWTQNSEHWTQNSEHWTQNSEGRYGARSTEGMLRAMSHEQWAKVPIARSSQLSQSQIVQLFQSSKANISEHIKSIYLQNELDRDSTVRNFRTVRVEGDREVFRNITYYNLDVKTYTIDLL